MSYSGIVCAIQLHPFPGADKLKLGMVNNHQVITGADVLDGTMGVFFPTDGQLSHEFCYQNNLYREGKGQNKDPGKFGYFDEKRRVKSLKMRGQISEGFWVPLEALAYTNAAITPGMTISTLGEHLICNKYMTAATLKAQGANKQGQQRKQNPMFAKHNDTLNIRYGWDVIREGTPLIITLKQHGTSGRTGLVLDELPTSWYTSYVQKALSWLGLELKTQEWKHITGTRNTVLAELDQEDNLGKESYRHEIHNRFKKLDMYPGEVFYYEIVGYGGGSPIMSRHGVDPKSKNEADKFIFKQYGQSIVYSYGQPQGTYEIYVYRITHVGTDGHTTEYSWDAVKSRCEQLGLKTVPELARLIKQSDTLEQIKAMTDGPDPLDPTHPREGVCVRVDSPRHAIYKFKGWTFSYLEGITKDDEGYVDLEEAS